MPHPVQALPHPPLGTSPTRLCLPFANGGSGGGCLCGASGGDQPGSGQDCGRGRSGERHACRRACADTQVNSPIRPGPFQECVVTAPGAGRSSLEEVLKRALPQSCQIFSRSEIRDPFDAVSYSPHPDVYACFSPHDKRPFHVAKRDAALCRFDELCSCGLISSHTCTIGTAASPASADQRGATW